MISYMLSAFNNPPVPSTPIRLDVRLIFIFIFAQNVRENYEL